MSEVSLLRGVYADIVTYCEMVDRVIQHLGSEIQDPNRKKLGQLLVDASDQSLESQSVEALKLGNLLRSMTGEPYAGLKRLGERLLSEQIDSSTVEQLEALAQKLDLERVEIGRRLRRE